MENELIQSIKMEIEKYSIHTDTKDDRILERLVEPFLVSCRDIYDNKLVDVYIVFKSSPELSESSQLWIGLDPTSNSFALIQNSSVHKAPEIISYAGTFLDVFFGM